MSRSDVASRARSSTRTTIGAPPRSSNGLSRGPVALSRAPMLDATPAARREVHRTTPLSGRCALLAFARRPAPFLSANNRIRLKGLLYPFAIWQCLDQCLTTGCNLLPPTPSRREILVLYGCISNRLGRVANPWLGCLFVQKRNVACLELRQVPEMRKVICKASDTLNLGAWLLVDQERLRRCAGERCWPTNRAAARPRVHKDLRCAGKIQFFG